MGGEEEERRRGPEQSGFSVYRTLSDSKLTLNPQPLQRPVASFSVTLIPEYSPYIPQ